jgi:hypothetical protein
MGSNDGNIWSIIDTKTQQSSSIVKTYSITPISIRYIRLIITGLNQLSLLSNKYQMAIQGFVCLSESSDFVKMYYNDTNSAITNLTSTSTTYNNCIVSLSWSNTYVDNLQNFTFIQPEAINTNTYNACNIKWSWTTSPYVSIDYDTTGLISYLPLENSLVDHVTNITWSSNSQVSYSLTSSINKYALQCNNTQVYSNFQIESDCTVGCWINVTTLPNTGVSVILMYGNVLVNNWYITINNNSILHDVKQRHIDMVLLYFLRERCYEISILQCH